MILERVKVMLDDNICTFGTFQEVFLTICTSFPDQIDGLKLGFYTNPGEWSIQTGILGEFTMLHRRSLLIGMLHIETS